MLLTPSGMSVDKSLTTERSSSHFEKKFIKCRKYKNSRFLAKGKFGAVYFAEDKNGRPIAAKVAIGSSKKLQKLIEREVNFMSSFEHPGIIVLLCADIRHLHCFYTMEFAKGGNLNERFKTNKASEKCAQHIFKQIVQAVSYLHNEKKVIHHDIKADNVLLMSVDCFPVAKLTDFGLTATIVETKKHNVASGSYRYKAPEKLKLQLRVSSDIKPCNEKVDIYAIGITLLGVLVAPIKPFKSKGKQLAEIESGKLLKRMLGQLQMKKSKDLLSFFCRCLEIKEENRASADELLRHPWLAVSCGTDKTCSDSSSSSDSGDRSDFSFSEDSASNCFL